MDFVTEAAKFGPYALFLMVFLVGGKWIVDKMLTVIANNTEAITKLCVASAETESALRSSDERGQRIETAVLQVVRVVDRLEQKVDGLGGFGPGRMARREEREEEQGDPIGLHCGNQAADPAGV